MCQSLQQLWVKESRGCSHASKPASQRIIAVFGSATVEENSPEYQAARNLGSLIARRGWTVCNGGYGGVMEASARGASEAGGHTIGVTLSLLGRGSANAYIQQEIAATSLFERLMRLIEPSSACILFPGGCGTLLELAAVWELTTKKLIAPRPIVLLGAFWEPVVATVLTAQPAAGPITRAADPAAADKWLASHFDQPAEQIQ